MKYHIKNIVSYPTYNKGFTLIELLVATVIMSIVVTIAGTGFVAILQQNQKAELATQRRTNLNRALDHIANDIRSANTIESEDSPGVFKLTIPANRIDGDAEKTLTYSITDSNSIWEGPKSIELDSSFLVDGIKNPQSNPTCPSDPDDPSKNSTLAGSNGFYACIYDDGNKADIYLYGKLSGTSNETLEVKSTVFTRAN